MANTTIPIELSSTPGIVDNSNATAITIDSSENVGIGTSSVTNNTNRTTLGLQGAWGGQLDIMVGATVHAQFGTDNFDSGLSCRIQSQDGIAFKAGGATERMRIDSAGNVFVKGGQELRLNRGDNATYGSIKYLTGSGGLQLNDQNSDGITFVRGGSSESMRIDSGGNLLVGGTSTSTIPSLNKGVFVLSQTNGDVIGYSLYNAEGSNNRRASFFLDDTNGVYGFDTTASSGVCTFVVKSAGTERMRINTNGSIEISGNGANNEISQFLLNVGNPGNDSYRPMSCHVASTAARSHILFYNPAGQVGYISTSGTSTAYNTSSDYRLKENVVTDWDATTRLKQLKPSRFNFIADADTTVDGFLAHEVQDIVPEAITGTKDATEELTNVVINNLGNVIARDIEEDDWIAGKEDETYPADSTWEATHTANVYQGIDQAKLVPLLTKALQEQQALIESLEARITTLEG